MAFSFCGRRMLLRRISLLSTIRQNGYIVLVPEIGEDLPEKNPLLQNDGLPEFNNIAIENCMAAVAKQTLDFEAGVKEIEKTLGEKENADVFADVFTPLEELGSPLDMTWGLSKTLYLGNSTLMPTKSYLAIHERAKRARAAKFNSPKIFETVQAELAKETDRTSEEARILRKFALEGRLNGLELNSNRKAHLGDCLNKLNAEKVQFKQKIEYATKHFSHTITDGVIVRDFPQDLLQVITVNSDNYMQGPWKVTLQPHIYLPVMENCPDRDIRWNIWAGLVDRGSGFGNKELSTSVNLEKIREARCDMAKLLGFDTFADMSMETKMAGSVDNAHNTLRALLDRAKPAQDRELENLYEFALERGFKSDRIELWDVPYWRRKQQRTEFDYHEDSYKKYFPLPKVLDGLFQLCEKLFDITISPKSNISTWHKDVKFYNVFESHTSAPIAGFYIDPYARSNEKIRFPASGGWMVGIQNQSRITNSKPLAALVFNFGQPTAERPSLLTFREIRSLFHKFGQALQHLLTRTNYSDVSGSSNIEWDAVEISGHLMSHWLYNKSTIDSISCHCDSEDKLPTKMFDSLIQVHRHLSGVDLCRELYLSALDLELHHSNDYWLDIVKKLWPEFRSFPLDKCDSHPCSFTQIFTEEWGAAYYSHVWSRMIAADVYSAFHEVQDDEQKIADVGRRFRNTFLALGGSNHPSNTFRKFRGRDPSPKALLKSLGIKKLKPEE